MSPADASAMLWKFERLKSDAERRRESFNPADFMAFFLKNKRAEENVPILAFYLPL